MRSRWCDIPARTMQSVGSTSRAARLPGRRRTTGNCDAGTPAGQALVPSDEARRSSRLSFQPVELILEFRNRIFESQEPVPLLRDYGGRCALREAGIGQLASCLGDLAFQSCYFFFNARDFRNNVDLDFEHQVRLSTHCYWGLRIRERINEAGMTEFRQALHEGKQSDERFRVAR